MAEICALQARVAPQTRKSTLRHLIDLSIPACSHLAGSDRRRHLAFDTLCHAEALETKAAVAVTADDSARTHACSRRVMRACQPSGSVGRLGDTGSRK